MMARVIKLLKEPLPCAGSTPTGALCKKMQLNLLETVHNAKWQTGSIIANGPLDLLCIDFTKMDPSRMIRRMSLS